MSLSRERIELIKENKELRKDRDKWKLDYKVLDERASALELTLQETEAKLKKLHDEGALGYIEKDGYIISLSELHPYSKRTFVQPIPEELKKAIGTVLYTKYPFGKVVNGVVEIDIDQYKKYIGGIVL